MLEVADYISDTSLYRFDYTEDFLFTVDNRKLHTHFCWITTVLNQVEKIWLKDELHRYAIILFILVLRLAQGILISLPLSFTFLFLNRMIQSLIFPLCFGSKQQKMKHRHCLHPDYCTVCPPNFPICLQPGCAMRAISLLAHRCLVLWQKANHRVFCIKEEREWSLGNKLPWAYFGRLLPIKH